jgi:hypothetical protein
VKRWWALTLIFVAGTGAGGAVVWGVSRDGSSGSKSSSTTIAAAKPAVTATGQELLDRLAAGQKATFHVRYSYGNATGANAVLEVWHASDRVRRDIIVIAPTEGTSHTEEFLEKAQYTRCLLLDGQPWQCDAAPAQTANLIDPLGGANHDVTGRTVTVTDDTIAGHAVRCYHVDPASATAKPSQFCLSAENVPLRIDGGDGKPVDATNYDFTVPDSAFTHPAPLTTPGAA